ncbi:MAG TPA: hypothetical protein VI958_00690, partial [Acidobacteriota bacterium]
ILRFILLISLYLILISRAESSGHGPVFGLATPTNAQDGWSLDTGLMSRIGNDTGTMFRSMLSYGITEDLQVSFSAPWIFETAPLPPARQTAMMPGTFDTEAILAWRFHRTGADIGTRLESTAYAGFLIPSAQDIKGMLGELEKSSGLYLAAATGMASRSHYIWGGIGYSRFSKSKGDQRPDVFFYSLVWGYRPQAWRKDYPHWDWRWFVELTGEVAGKIQRDGAELSETGGHQIFLGPSVLGIYKDVAVEAGLQFPIYRDIGSLHQKEKRRYALNFSYFF